MKARWLIWDKGLRWFKVVNVIVYAFITEYQHIDTLYPEIIPI